MKEHIEVLLNIPTLHQKLIHTGKTLADDKTIGFYATIKDGTKLTLVVKKPDPLNEIIMRHFKKHYTETQAEKLTKEFMLDFEAKLKTYSLEDLERLATNCMSTQEVRQ